MPKKIAIPILYEDEFLLAVNKPAGVVSVPDPNTPLPHSVLGMVQDQCESRGFKPYLLHRLDSPTSGVLLFGKFPRDREALESITRESGTQKKYIALVKGFPRGNTLNSNLKSRQTGELIPATTDFRILRRLELFGTPCSIIEAEIKSGRKHQIRQHFAQIHCPVVMDSEYGDPKFNKKFRMEFHFSRLFLHSRSMRFVHPITKHELTIEAPFPPDMQSFMKKVFGRGKELF